LLPSLEVYHNDSLEQQIEGDTQGGGLFEVDMRSCQKSHEKSSVFDELVYDLIAEGQSREGGARSGKCQFFDKTLSRIIGQLVVEETGTVGEVADIGDCFFPTGKTVPLCLDELLHEGRTVDHRLQSCFCL